LVWQTYRSYSTHGLYMENFPGEGGQPSLTTFNYNAGFQRISEILTGTLTPGYAH